MTCFGEIGNHHAQNPEGWNTKRPSSKTTLIHSFCSLVLVYAEKVDEKKSVVSQISSAMAALTPRSLAALTPRSAAKYKASQVACAVDEPAETAAVVAVAAATPHAEVVAPSGREIHKTFDEVSRAIPFAAAGVPDKDGIHFWKVVDGATGDWCYAKSHQTTDIDAFISHVWFPDPKSPLEMMQNIVKYAVHKCVDVFIASSSIVVRGGGTQALTDITFWVDRACVEQNDAELKMYTIANHLENFIAQSKYFVVLMSTKYFTRLWSVAIPTPLRPHRGLEPLLSLPADPPPPPPPPTARRCVYEFASAAVFHSSNLDSIVIANACLCFFDVEKVRVSEAIATISVKGCHCVDNADRVLIESKITQMYVSFEAFERFAKFAAIALNARMAVAWAAEYYNDWLYVWSKTATNCGFPELAAVIDAVNVEELRAKARATHPDAPAETFFHERLAFIENTFAKEWFATTLAPMVMAERNAAVKPDAKIGNLGMEKMITAEPAAVEPEARTRQIPKNFLGKYQ